MSTALSKISGVSLGLSLRAHGELTVSGSPDNITNDIVDNPKVASFKLGTSPPGQLNEIIRVILSLAPSATNNLQLSNTLKDICGQVASLSKIVAIKVHNLSATDTGGLANPATSITLGAAGANPWITILNSTGTITLATGAYWFHYDPNGVAVAANSILKILNNDAVNTANVMVTIYGIG